MKRRRENNRRQGTGRATHIRPYPLIFAAPEPAEVAAQPGAPKTPGDGLPAGSTSTTSSATAALQRKRSWLYTPCEGVPERASYHPTADGTAGGTTSSDAAGVSFPFTPIEGVPERAAKMPRLMLSHADKAAASSQQAAKARAPPPPRFSPAFSHATYGNAVSHLNYSAGADEDDGVDGPVQQEEEEDYAQALGRGTSIGINTATPQPGAAAAVQPPRTAAKGARRSRREIEIQTGASISKDKTAAPRPAVVFRASMAIGTDDAPSAAQVDASAGPSAACASGSGLAGAPSARTPAAPAAARTPAPSPLHQQLPQERQQEGEQAPPPPHHGPSSYDDDDDGDVGADQDGGWWDDARGGDDDGYDDQQHVGGGFDAGEAGPSAAAVTPAAAEGGANAGRRSRARGPNGYKSDAYVRSRKSLVGAGLMVDDGAGGVRKSSRQRGRPLEWWRNERKVFGREHRSLPTVVGLETRTPNPAWPADGRQAAGVVMGGGGKTKPRTHKHHPHEDDEEEEQPRQKRQKPAAAAQPKQNAKGAKELQQRGKQKKRSAAAAAAPKQQQQRQAAASGYDSEATLSDADM